MMHWSAKFVGLPWAEKGRAREGVDCWGLCHLVYAEALGVTLPSYVDQYACVAERAEIAALMSSDSLRWPWAEVPLEDAREFDIALFSRAGLQSHVGIVIAAGRMLHIDSERHSCIETYLAGRWRPRLIGIYRHAEVPHGA